MNENSWKGYTILKIGAFPDYTFKLAIIQLNRIENKRAFWITPFPADFRKNFFDRLEHLNNPRRWHLLIDDLFFSS